MPGSYTTAGAIWPTAVSVPPEVQQLVARFYELADLADPNAGNRFATEVFVPTGIMAAAGSQGFKGEADIRKSREHAWDAVSARHHQVLRVFAADPAGLDLMLIGKVEMTVRRTGKNVSGEFTARFVVEPEGIYNGEPRLLSSTVWADSAPLLAALQE
ncbi:hypothetical protein BDV06DRAFT_223897 [Aspergillus oleicola]